MGGRPCYEEVFWGFAIFEVYGLMTESYQGFCCLSVHLVGELVPIFGFSSCLARSV